MSVSFDKVYRIRSSIALVHVNNQLEMFKSNLRESLKIKIENKNIINILSLFDGKINVRSISDIIPLENKDDLFNLIEFLNSNNILIEVDQPYPNDIFLLKYRLINLIEEYFTKTSDVLKCLENIQNKIVMVVGLGAVGSWVVDSLARIGIKQFIIVDDDKVDLSNLHRQNYFFNDIGKYKVDCIENNLNAIFNDIKCLKIHEKIGENFFNRYPISSDLVINCADYPSVDETSYIIGKACMKTKTPHIIGGGYNLHLTLIGQTVIPYETPCVKCFDTELKKINMKELDGVKKLNRPNRKVGSFGPLCSLSASITAIEAFKVLINQYQKLVTTGKRIEFRIKEQDFFNKIIPRDVNCEWCGQSN
jgi:tRNA A37 threonylcarbamoyladenosine dehydratase